MPINYFLPVVLSLLTSAWLRTRCRISHSSLETRQLCYCLGMLGTYQQWMKPFKSRFGGWVCTGTLWNVHESMNVPNFYQFCGCHSFVCLARCRFTSSDPQQRPWICQQQILTLPLWSLVQHSPTRQDGKDVKKMEFPSIFSHFWWFCHSQLKLLIAILFVDICCRTFNRLMAHDGPTWILGWLLNICRAMGG